MSFSGLAGSCKGRNRICNLAWCSAEPIGKRIEYCGRDDGRINIQKGSLSLFVPLKRGLKFFKAELVIFIQVDK